MFSRPCQSIGWEKHSVSRHVLYNLSVAILDQAIWAQAIPAQVSLVETTWLPTSPSSAKPMLARYARKWKQGNDNRLLASFPGCRRGCFNYKLFSAVVSAAIGPVVSSAKPFVHPPNTSYDEVSSVLCLSTHTRIVVVLTFRGSQKTASPGSKRVARA